MRFNWITLAAIALMVSAPALGAEKKANKEKADTPAKAEKPEKAEKPAKPAKTDEDKPAKAGERKTQGEQARKQLEAQERIAAELARQNGGGPTTRPADAAPMTDADRLASLKTRLAEEKLRWESRLASLTSQEQDLAGKDTAAAKRKLADLRTSISEERAAHDRTVADLQQKIEQLEQAARPPA